jgi:hypothetical protein
LPESAASFFRREYSSTGFLLREMKLSYFGRTRNSRRKKRYVSSGIGCTMQCTLAHPIGLAAYPAADAKCLDAILGYEACLGHAVAVKQ